MTNFIHNKRHLWSWWRHQMETFSALLTICAGNSPVTGEFPTQRPVTRSFDVFFHLWLNKWLRKQPWGWRFEMLLRSLWCHRNDIISDEHLPTSLHRCGPRWRCVSDAFREMYLGIILLKCKPRINDSDKQNRNTYFDPGALRTTC